jgi:hypothetical protein
VQSAAQGGSSDVEVELRNATSRTCNSTSPATPHKRLEEASDFHNELACRSSRSSWLDPERSARPIDADNCPE